MRLNQPRWWPSARQTPVEDRSRTPNTWWRVAVPTVCLLAGLLLATTHTVSGGGQIRGSEAPRLVDLVREAQRAVDGLGTQRDGLAAQIDSTHGAASGPALTAIENRVAALGDEAGLDAVQGPGVSVTLTDARRDADGRFPRDASPDDLVVHQQDIQAVLNALWGAGAEAVALQDQRVIATSAPRCVGNTLLLNGRTYSPPYTVTAIGDPAALSDALAADPQIRLYKQYVIRFGLGYTEQASDNLEIPGYTRPLRMRYARPAGPLVY